jgi:hypothetical protein
VEGDRAVVQAVTVLSDLLFVFIVGVGNAKIVNLLALLLGLARLLFSNRKSC